MGAWGHGDLQRSLIRAFAESCVAWCLCGASRELCIGVGELQVGDGGVLLLDLALLLASPMSLESGSPTHRCSPLPN